MWFRKNIHLLGIALWVALILGAIYLASIKRLVLFDPAGTLSQQVSSFAFSQPFKQIIGAKHGSLVNKVVHFSNENCYCQNVANSHINSVKRLANDAQFINIQQNLTEPLAHFIPSTPAVAVFDHQENLVYFGPYSSGFFCSAGSGIVEKFLKPTNRKNYIGAVVLADSKGCYCAS